MSTPTDPSSLIPVLRRLTVAVWALVGILGLYVALMLAMYIPTLFQWGRVTKVNSVNVGEYQPQNANNNTNENAKTSRTTIVEHDRFSDHTLDEQIAQATAIMIGRYSEASADAPKCRITEMLKRAPNVEHYYQPGGPCPDWMQSRDPHEPGESHLLFFTGNPTTFRYSVSFTGDRVNALGNISLTNLREKIQTPPRTP